MDIRKLQRAIVDGLEDVKAQHIAVFNTEHLSSLFERVIIASGTSNRQTKALAASVRESVKSRGMQVMSVEGEDNGEWIIVDCGAAVVHVMQPAIREYYHLEEIWGGKAVRLKVGEVNTKLVKASEPEPVAKVGKAGKAVKDEKPARKARAQIRADHDAVRPARNRNAARDAATDEAAAAPKKRTAAKKASPETADQKTSSRSAAFKRVATKAPQRFTRESTAPATKTVVVKPAGAKKPAAKKVAGNAAPAKRPAAKKAPAKTAATKTAAKVAAKPAAKKAAPRKTTARTTK